jgi:hypothetical protein
MTGHRIRDRFSRHLNRISALLLANVPPAHHALRRQITPDISNRATFSPLTHSQVEHSIPPNVISDADVIGDDDTLYLTEEEIIKNFRDVETAMAAEHDIKKLCDSVRDVRGAFKIIGEKLAVFDSLNTVTLPRAPVLYPRETRPAEPFLPEWKTLDKVSSQRLRDLTFLTIWMQRFEDGVRQSQSNATKALSLLKRAEYNPLCSTIALTLLTTEFQDVTLKSFLESQDIGHDGLDSLREEVLRIQRVIVFRNLHRSSELLTLHSKWNTIGRVPWTCRLPFSPFPTTSDISKQNSSASFHMPKTS